MFGEFPFIVMERSFDFLGAQFFVAMYEQAIFAFIARALSPIVELALGCAFPAKVCPLFFVKTVWVFIAPLRFFLAW